MFGHYINAFVFIHLTARLNNARKCSGRFFAPHGMCIVEGYYDMYYTVSQKTSLTFLTVTLKLIIRF